MPMLANYSRIEMTPYRGQVSENAGRDRGRCWHAKCAGTSPSSQKNRMYGSSSTNRDHRIQEYSGEFLTAALSLH